MKQNICAKIDGFNEPLEPVLTRALFFRKEARGRKRRAKIKPSVIDLKFCLNCSLHSNHRMTKIRNSAQLRCGKSTFSQWEGLFHLKIMESLTVAYFGRERNCTNHNLFTKVFHLIHLMEKLKSILYSGLWKNYILQHTNSCNALFKSVSYRNFVHMSSPDSAVLA